MNYLKGNITVANGTLDAEGKLVVDTKFYEDCFIFLTECPVSNDSPTLLALKFTGYSDIEKTTMIFQRNEFRMDVIASEPQDITEIRALRQFQIVAPLMTLVS